MSERKINGVNSRGKVYFYSADREQVQSHDSVVKSENGKLVQASENQVYLSFCNDNADERCLRQQCEISIVCDDGSFSSPKECALAPSLTEGCCLQLLNLLANRQYRQQLVMRSADAVCTAWDAKKAVLSTRDRLVF